MPHPIEALSEAAAVERAVALFSLDDERRKRLAVNLRGRLDRPLLAGAPMSESGPTTSPPLIDASVRMGGNRLSEISL